MSKYWYGTKPNGEKVKIAHADLMAWAIENNQQYQIGWGTEYTMPDGTVLKREKSHDSTH